VHARGAVHECAGHVSRPMPHPCPPHFRGEAVKGHCARSRADTIHGLAGWDGLACSHALPVGLGCIA
jgi:hypothetical protein